MGPSASVQFVQFSSFSSVHDLFRFRYGCPVLPSRMEGSIVAGLVNDNGVTASLRLETSSLSPFYFDVIARLRKVLAIYLFGRKTRTGGTLAVSLIMGRNGFTVQCQFLCRWDGHHCVPDAIKSSQGIVKAWTMCDSASLSESQSGDSSK